MNKNLCSCSSIISRKKNHFLRCNKVKLLLQTKHGHLNFEQFYNLQYI